jgi:hypothetical protein
VGVSLAVASVAFPAFAQGEGGAAAAAAAESRGRYREGVQLTHQRKYELARAKFLEAIALDGEDAEAVLSLSVVETDLGHPVAAYVALRKYLKHPKADGATAAKARTRMVAALEAKVGQIAVTASPGAEVTVDGVSVGRAPLEETAVVVPGAHVVAVAGVNGSSQSVEVGAGAKVAVSLVAAVEPVAPPVVPPLPDVHPAPAVPPAGEASGGGWSGAKIGTVVGLGALGVAGIVVGVVENSARSSREDDAAPLAAANQHCPANPSAVGCAKLASLKSSYDSDRTLTGVFVISGAVVAAGAVAAAIFWPNRRPSDASQGGLHLTPMVGVTACGLQLNASF